MIPELQRQLGIDSSFFIQFAIFVFIFLWLRVVFFKPYLALIQKRDSQSDGLVDEGQRLEEEAIRMEEERASTLNAAKKVAAQNKDNVLAHARQQAGEIVTKARNEAKTKLEQARESTEKGVESELSSLKSQVADLSKMLVEKLTKTQVGL